MKKLAALLLAAIFIFFPLLSVAGAAESVSEDLNQIIRSQYRAYAQAKERAGADNNLITQFWNHAMNGGNISAGENSDLAAVVLNTDLFEEAFVDTVSNAVTQAGNIGREKLFLRSSSMCWYDYKLSYRFYMFDDNENGIETDDRKIGAVQGAVTYVDGGNSHDDVMMLLTGTADANITLTKISIAKDTVTYKVDIKVKDRFDFGGSYDHDKNKGFDTTKAELLTLAGKLLGLREFDWSVTAGFTLTIPYSCDHSYHSYGWDHVDGALVSRMQEGYSENRAEQLISYKEDGTERSRYYRLDDEILLSHNSPWVVEFTIKGWGRIYLSSVDGTEYEVPYLMRTSTSRVGTDGEKEVHQFLFVGRFVRMSLNLKEMLEFGLNKLIYYGYERCGVDFTDSYQSGKEQTFRYENHVFPDGSNEIRIYVDGVEQGAVQDRYFRMKETEHVYRDTVPGWSNGMDIAVSYVGSQSIAINSAVKSLTIYTGGGLDAVDAFRSEVTAPTCTQMGYTTHTCVLCSYSYKDSYTNALGHQETAAVTEPTCTQPGHVTYTCTVCAVSREMDGAVALGHSYGQGRVIWSRDCLSAQVEADCTTCGHTYEEQVRVSSVCTGTGEITLMAGTSIDKQEIRDVRTVTAKRNGDIISVTLPGAVDDLQLMVAGYSENGRLAGVAMASMSEAQCVITQSGTRLRLFFLKQGSLQPVFPTIEL